MLGKLAMLGMLLMEGGAELLMDDDWLADEDTLAYEGHGGICAGELGSSATFDMKCRVSSASIARRRSSRSRSAFKKKKIFKKYI